MSEPRKKKFFAALSLDDKGERAPVKYKYSKSSGIDRKYEMAIHNPIMAFLMDRVLPGETVDLYLVVCRGDCYDVDETPRDKEKRDFEREFAKTFEARTSEIFGAKEETFSGTRERDISAFTGPCDLGAVREMFKQKNGPDATFTLRWTYITDDDEDGARYGNSSKAYIKLLLNLITLIENRDTLYIDYTYGFKPLVHVWRNLCAFAARAKADVEIDVCSYGSMHGINNDQETIYNHSAMFSLDEIITNSSLYEDATYIVVELLKDSLIDYPDEDEYDEGDGDE